MTLVTVLMWIAFAGWVVAQIYGVVSAVRSFFT